MRRWARTRFMPDDCGLKPPIETLPQIAQERAMRGPQEVGGQEVPSPERARTGRYDSTRPPTRHARTPPDPPCEEDAARVPIRPNARPIARHPPRRRRHRPDRDARLVRRHRVRGEPARAAARPARVSPSRASASGSAAGSTIELDLTVAYGVPIAEVARQVDSAVRYAIRRALGREVDRLTIHVDGAARTRRRRAAGTVRRDPTDASAPRDLADSGTDVA